jgi:hypothetical protein
VSLDSYGLESVTGVQLLTELQKDFPELPMTLLFEFPTAKGIAGHLADKFADQLIPVLKRESKVEELVTQ